MWEGYSDELYNRIVEQRHNGERIDRVTTGGIPNSYIGSISGGRIPMVSNQTSTYLPLKNPDTPQLLSGVELDYARGLIDVRNETDEEAIIHSIIPKYRVQPGLVDKCYSKSVIYRTRSGMLAEVEIPAFFTQHMWACATMHETDVMEQLGPGDIIRPNEVLAHTRTRTKNENLAIGVNLNATYYGTFGTNEDGVEVNMDAIPKLVSEKYEIKNAYLQPDEVLLDIHGNNDWQGLPIAGQHIPANGMAFAIRRSRKAFNLVNLTTNSLKCPQAPFDLRYRIGKGMEIIEVKVIKNARGDFKHMPRDQVNYLDRLADNACEYHRRILEIDAAERRDKGPDYPRHPSWQIVVTQAIQHLYISDQLPRYLQKEAKMIPNADGTLQDKAFTYHISIVAKGDNVPTLGHKITGLCGEKAVICAIKPPEEMYKDKWGRISDINANPNGVSNRNNPSQLFRCFTADACFHTLRKLKTISSKDKQLEFLKEFYRLASLESCRSFILASKKQQLQHLDNVLNHRIDLIDEVGDPTTTVDIVGMLKDTPYYPPRDVVTFRDSDGKIKTSKSKVRVAAKHVIMLDKIGKYSSVCNVALRQALGFAAKLTPQDKAVTHISTASNRLIGNTETRMMFGNLDPVLAQYILNTGNSIEYGEKQIDSILNGDLMVDGDLDTKYTSRGVEYFRSLLRTFGCDIKTGDE